MFLGELAFHGREETGLGMVDSLRLISGLLGLGGIVFFLGIHRHDLMPKVDRRGCDTEREWEGGRNGKYSGLLVGFSWAKAETRWFGCFLVVLGRFSRMIQFTSSSCGRGGELWEKNDGSFHYLLPAAHSVAQPPI